MARLLLIRHGQTPANVDGVLESSVPGPVLTPLGVRQAAALPDRLAGEPLARIVASDLIRAVRTAQPLAAARSLPVDVDPRLREVVAGDLEGRRDPASHRAYLEPVFAWAAGDLDARIPGSPEDGHAFFARFDAAVDDALQGTSGPVAIVSHGAAIRVWTAVRATGPGVRDAERGLANTGVVVLEGGDGHWRVREILEVREPDPAEDPAGGGEP